MYCLYVFLRTSDILLVIKCGVSCLGVRSIYPREGPRALLIWPLAWVCATEQRMVLRS